MQHCMCPKFIIIFFSLNLSTISVVFVLLVCTRIKKKTMAQQMTNLLNSLHLMIYCACSMVLYCCGHTLCVKANSHNHKLQS